MVCVYTYIIVHGLDMIIMYIKRKVGNTQLSKRHVVNYHLMNESVCVCVCVCVFTNQFHFLVTTLLAEGR